MIDFLTVFGAATAGAGVALGLKSWIEGRRSPQKPQQNAQVDEPKESTVSAPAVPGGTHDVPEHLRNDPRCAEPSVVRAYKRSPPRTELPPDVMDRAVELRAASYPVKVIARQLGVSYGILRKRLKERDEVKP